MLNKEKPIYQFYSYDRFDLLPLDDFDQNMALDFRDLYMNFGPEVLKKL
jgi:hypothetical protein